MACRINHSRIWTARLMLEAQSHELSLFATLTYKDEPENGNLRKEHLSSTLHRLRASASYSYNRSVRFYGVGEYGDQLGRPHYHVALFGLPVTSVVPNAAIRSGFSCELLDTAWKRAFGGDGDGTGGHVDLGILNADSAAYITGYVTKKLTKRDDPRLDGREPEFALMSRRPGIGSAALPALIATLNTSEGALYLARHKDVPAAFKVGSRLMPIGPHLRGQLREFFFGEPTQPKVAKEEANHRFNQNIWAHLPPMQVDATEGERLCTWYEAQAESRDAYLASLRQKNRKLIKRTQISNSRKTL